MSRPTVPPTGKEVFFPEDQIIVSKTDLKGIITYANTLFEKISGYDRAELLGQPHNIIRHPDMPQCIFKLLWDTLGQQKEIFAYVDNLCKNGDHYWVLAHIVPSYDIDGNHVGYHSSRRCPKRNVIREITPFYNKLLEIEKTFKNPKEAMRSAGNYLDNFLQKQNISYAGYIFSLTDG